MSCLIWGTAATVGPKTGDKTVLDSPRAGGRYAITGSAEPLATAFNERQKARLTTWLVDQHIQGVTTPLLDSETAKWAGSLQNSSVSSRLDRLLIWLSKNTSFAGERLKIVDGVVALSMFAWTESINSRELWFLLKTLNDAGLVEADSHSGGYNAKILAGGYEHLDALAARPTVSIQGFVAMWFSDELTDIYDHGMAPAIVDAGFSPMRIDRKAHNNKIDDEIVAEIRRSRFLVADFTHGAEGARGGVYYEAGFAHGLGLPVIFTVRKDQIDKTHFDTRQYAHIMWADAADLRRQLADRISATIGDGPARARV